MGVLRICKKCKKEKVMGEFSKSPECKFGYRYECKECRRKRYIPKGPCKDNASWFKRGHEFIAGGEKGWFVKGRKPDGIHPCKGKKPHNYIDGKSRLRARDLRKAFQGSKALEIRLKMLERDGYMCVNCKDTNKKLHAHHIIPLRIDSSKAYHLDNLMTLCPKCHAMEEKKKINQ